MVTVPVAHGEGRVVADDATLAQLIENGQIATFDVPPAGETVKVKNLEISFANADGSSAFRRGQ